MCSVDSHSDLYKQTAQLMTEYRSIKLYLHTEQTTETPESVSTRATGCNDTQLNSWQVIKGRRL